MDPIEIKPLGTGEHVEDCCMCRNRSWVTDELYYAAEPGDKYKLVGALCDPCKRYVRQLKGAMSRAGLW